MVVTGLSPCHRDVCSRPSFSGAFYPLASPFPMCCNRAPIGRAGFSVSSPGQALTQHCMNASAWPRLLPPQSASDNLVGVDGRLDVVDSWITCHIVQQLSLVYGARIMCLSGLRFKCDETYILHFWTFGNQIQCARRILKAPVCDS